MHSQHPAQPKGDAQAHFRARKAPFRMVVHGACSAQLSMVQHCSASFSMAQHGSAQHCMLMHRFEHEMHNPHTPPKGPCTPLGPLGQPCIPMVTNMAIQHSSAQFSMVQLSSAQHPLAMHGFAGGVHSPHAPPKGPCTPLGPPRAHGTRHNTPQTALCGCPWLGVS